MYEETIQDLRDKAEFLRRANRDSNIHNSFAETMSQAADTIEELSDRNVGKWIPVTERLPEPGWYLVRCNEVHKHIHRIAYYYNYCNPAWYEDSNNITEFVTHWISLPEPPKEET